MSEYIIKADEWAIDYNGDSLFKNAEEIVRCKDCVRWRDDCEWNRFFNDPDLDSPLGYCAWGERRER